MLAARASLSFLAVVLAGTCFVSAIGSGGESTSQERIAGLIAQLGDSDLRARDEAAAGLLAIGKEALPLLKEAARLDDPEVRLRAEQLLRRLEQRPIPGGPIKFSRPERITAHSLNLSMKDGARVVEVNEDGRQIQLSEGADFVEVKIRTSIEGRHVAETFRAASAEQLRRDNPDVGRILDRWITANPVGGIIVNGGQVIIGGRLVQDGQPIVLQPIEALRNLLVDRMEEMRTPAPEAAEVLRLLERVEAVSELRADFAELEGDRDRRLSQLFARSDDLRKKLDELKLPDGGEALPPPPNARLGIQLDRGMQVTKVVSGSRGQLIGLKERDVIHKLNGRAIATISDLRQALAESHQPLVLEGMREGVALELREK